MKDNQLIEWLGTDRVDLKEAIKASVRAHVEKIKAENPDFYGYAIIPGEPYLMENMVVVWNTLSAVKKNVEEDGDEDEDDLYRYYLYSVDDWENWDKEVLTSANRLIDGFNKQFRALHPENPDEIELDDYEAAHLNGLLNAILSALLELKEEGVFQHGEQEPFLAIWFSDAEPELILLSVQALNSEKVVEEFKEEFVE